MNIQALARTAARIGFSLAGQEEQGGALKKVTLYLGSSQDYDPEAGQDTTTWTHTVEDIDALIYAAKEMIVGGNSAGPNQLSSGASASLVNPKLATQAALIKREDLPEGAIVEQEDMIEVAGTQYRILSVDADPGKGTYIIHY